MDLTKFQSGSPPGLTSHIMESLCFSMSVYEQTQDAVLLDLQRRFGKVVPLIAYGFEEDGKQAIFVARSRSGRIVVACRGTASFRDILQDLKYLQSRLSFVKGAAAHWGFAERAESVPIDFFCKLLGDGEEVIFTGHSLGGAVASLLSLRVLESGKGKFDEQVHCITFGCPLFASCRLAELINSRYKDVFTHIVSKRDVVPKLLPAISTLQKLAYADEDHLEGLFVLKKALEFLPGVPLASLISGLERRVPSLVKFLFRCFMKLALPSGMTGSYAFAGHIVMLDTEAATVDKSLILASAGEMNSWYHQLGFSFGAGFDVTMIEEHMMECYYNGIVRNSVSQVRVERNLSYSGPSLRPPPMPAKVEQWSKTVEVDGCGGSRKIYNTGERKSNFVVRFVPKERSEGVVGSMDCEIQVRCDSSEAAPSIVVKHNILQDGGVRDLGLPALSGKIGVYSAQQAWPVGNEVGPSSARLMRTRSEGERKYVRSISRSTSCKLERSTSNVNSAAWKSRSARRESGGLVRSKELTVRCRACTHLQVHMNIKTCCHQLIRKGVGFGWFLGTIGRVARHLRILDNLCYLSFLRIVVANLVG